MHPPVDFFFFFNDTATTEIYTLSLHDALPICAQLLRASGSAVASGCRRAKSGEPARDIAPDTIAAGPGGRRRAGCRQPPGPGGRHPGDATLSSTLDLPPPPPHPPPHPLPPPTTH